ASGQTRARSAARRSRTVSSLTGLGGARTLTGHRAQRAHGWGGRASAHPNGEGGPMQKRWLSMASVLTAIALVAAACGGGGTSGTSASPGGSAAGSGGATAGGEIIIASDLPTSGADASSGLPTQNGAAFALSQTTSYKGIKITFKPYDDTVNGVHDPQKGAQNVQQMLSDPKTVAMVGPFNSNVARAEIPIANQGQLAMMSPSNTNECLTQDFPYCDPKPAALRPTGTN